MPEKLRKFIILPQTILVVYIIAALFASIQLISLGTHEFVMPKPGTYPDDIMHKPELMTQFLGEKLTDYNNYVIFKRSFFHLLSGQNLYGVYPSEHWDFYKYSPTFAFFMGALAWMPDWLGLTLWNLLNTLVLFLAVRQLPFDKQKIALILWFIGIELLTSLQNAQSNGLICGLLLASYAAMNKDKHWLAALWIVSAGFIKIYGIIGVIMFLFYPGKMKAVIYLALWTVVLAIIPLSITSVSGLLGQYQNWIHLLQADRSAAYGISVMGWLHTWFGLSSGKEWITILGLLLFLLPLARYKQYNNMAYRLMILANILIWVIIFNHKAESPTFIIAVTGVAIWYCTAESTLWRIVLMWVTFVFTIMSATDIFPPVVKQHFLIPYTIKVVPCIMVWAVLLFELMRVKNQKPVLV